MSEHSPSDGGPTPGELTVATKQQSDRLVLTLWGEVDLASAPTLEQELLAAEDSGAKEILLDFTGVAFMDSSGIRTLLEARRRADSRSHALLLSGCSDQIQRLFELTGVSDQFSFADQ